MLFHQLWLQCCCLARSFRRSLCLFGFQKHYVSFFLMKYVTREAHRQTAGTNIYPLDVGNITFCIASSRKRLQIFVFQPCCSMCVDLSKTRSSSRKSRDMYLFYGKIQCIRVLMLLLLSHNHVGFFRLLFSSTSLFLSHFQFMFQAFFFSVRFLDLCWSLTRSMYRCMCKLIDETIERCSMNTFNRMALDFFVTRTKETCIRAKSIRLHYEFCLKILYSRSLIDFDKTG